MIQFIIIVAIDSIFVYLWFRYLDNIRKKDQ
jgi:predicted membrane-bound mannosyltransferase